MSKNNKKIVILGVSLLILAGIIIIALKGLNVALMFGKHEAIEIKLDKEVDLAVVNDVCKDVFGNKKLNKRIRDVLKLYIKPMIISFVIVFVYMFIRFRKIDPTKIIIDFLAKIILTEAVLLSITAITRMPVSDILINLFMIVAVAQLICHISKSEKKLSEFNQE